MTSTATATTTNTVTKSGEISIYEFLSQTPEEQQDAWYDYFCAESSIPRKTVRLVAKLRKLSKSARINIHSQYVFFKNNQPLLGKCYDDFRICDGVTGDVIYTVIPAWGFDDKHQGKSVVYGRENGFDAPLVVGDWSDVMAYFGC